MLCIKVSTSEPQRFTAILKHHGTELFCVLSWKCPKQSHITSSGAELFSYTCVKISLIKCHSHHQLALQRHSQHEFVSTFGRLRK